MEQDMFLAGGLTLSQVCQISGLEPYTVQNWVKRGFLSNPTEAKKLIGFLTVRLIMIFFLSGIKFG